MWYSRSLELFHLPVDHQLPIVPSLQPLAAIIPLWFYEFDYFRDLM